MSQLVSVRSNMSFRVNYDNGQLAPSLELIMLVSKPEYTSDKKGVIKKVIAIQEIRFDTSLEGVNVLIGELQAMVANLNGFDQLAASINHVIKGKQEFDENNKKHQP